MCTLEIADKINVWDTTKGMPCLPVQNINNGVSVVLSPNVSNFVHKGHEHPTELYVVASYGLLKTLASRHLFAAAFVTLHRNMIALWYNKWFYNENDTLFFFMIKNNKLNMKDGLPSSVKASSVLRPTILHASNS